MDPAPSQGYSLKDVKWSSGAVPLDLLVSTYRLPQIARLDSVSKHLLSTYYVADLEKEKTNHFSIFAKKTSDGVMKSWTLLQND